MMRQQGWPDWLGQRCALDKWSPCWFLSWCADAGASRREGVARPEWDCQEFFVCGAEMFLKQFKLMRKRRGDDIWRRIGIR